MSHSATNIEKSGVFILGYDFFVISCERFGCQFKLFDIEYVAMFVNGFKIFVFKKSVV